jgi:hypothetical protein
LWWIYNKVSREFVVDVQREQRVGEMHRRKVKNFADEESSETDYSRDDFG